MDDDLKPGFITPEGLRAYIEHWNDSILVRVKIGCEFRDLSLKELRAIAPDLADAETVRLIDRGVLPHRRVFVV